MMSVAQSPYDFGELARVDHGGLPVAAWLSTALPTQTSEEPS